MSDLSATNCGCGNTCQNGGLFGGQHLHQLPLHSIATTAVIP